MSLKSICLYKFQKKRLTSLNKRETDSDPVISKLKKAILTGWPENRSEVEPQLQDYWNFRDRLCICDGLLMKGDRLITPCSLRDELLEIIHGSHGESPRGGKMSQQSKRGPVASCEVCAKHRNYQVNEPLLPHPVPDRP